MTFLHMVYMPCLTLMLLLNDARYPFLYISLYKHIHSEPFFEGVRVLARLIPFGWWFITHFSVNMCFDDKVLGGTQKMQVIKVTILSKNEVKIWKIHNNTKKVKIDKIMTSTKNILFFRNVTFEIWKISQFKSIFTP